mmetsp:Transcript_70115/g.157409  ORF Transcript_70115/g.157409 Transcript_70115/m.157409 type:complete len:215 (-) Transcript_70115:549-1193(-)
MSRDSRSSASRSSSCCRTRAKALRTLARPRPAARSTSFRRHASRSATEAKSSSRETASSIRAPARARRASCARVARKTSWLRCRPFFWTTHSAQMHMHSQVAQKYVAGSSGWSGHLGMRQVWLDVKSSRRSCGPVLRSLSAKASSCGSHLGAARCAWGAEAASRGVPGNEAAEAEAAASQGLAKGGVPARRLVAAPLQPCMGSRCICCLVGGPG